MSNVPEIYFHQLWAHGMESNSRRKVTAMDSMIYGYGGVRGSGKTRCLAVLAIKFMSLGFPAWLNFPVECIVLMPDGERRHVQSQMLDLKALLSSPHDYKGGLVGLDEIQYYADSRLSMSVKNRMVGYEIMQIRKMGLSFAYSVKWLRWAEPRVRQETDWWYQCREAYYCNDDIPGKGEKIYINGWEVSGITTGRQLDPDSPLEWQKSPDVQKELYFKPLWGCYDPNYVIDIYQAIQQLQVAQGKAKIGPNAKEEIQKASDSENPEADFSDAYYDRKTELQGKIASLKADYAGMTLTTDEMWEVLGVSGNDMALAGTVLRNMRVRRYGASGQKGRYVIPDLEKVPAGV